MGLTAAGWRRCFFGGLFSQPVHLAMHSGPPTLSNEIPWRVDPYRTYISPIYMQVDDSKGWIYNTRGIWTGPRGPRVKVEEISHLGLWSTGQRGTLLVAFTLREDAMEALQWALEGAVLKFPPGTLGVYFHEATLESSTRPVVGGDRYGTQGRR